MGYYILVGHVAHHVIKPQENSAYRHRVLESHPWQPRLFVDDKLEPNQF